MKPLRLLACVALALPLPVLAHGDRDRHHGLQAIFPSGVCDWSKRGYEPQDLDGTWQVID